MDYNDDLEETENGSTADDDEIYEHMDEMYDADDNESDDVIICSDVDDQELHDGTVELPFDRITEIFVLTFKRDTILDNSGNIIDQSGSVETDYFKYTNM